MHRCFRQKNWPHCADCRICAEIGFFFSFAVLTPDHDVNIHTGQLISCPQVQHNGAKSRTIDENPKTLKEPRAAKKSVINFGSSLTDKQHSTNRLSSNGELRGEHPSAKYGHFSSVNNVSCNEVSSSTHQSTHQSAHQSIEQPTHQSVHQQTQRSPPKHSSKSQAFSSLDDIIDRIRRDRKRINQKEEDDDDIEIVLVTPYKGLSSH